MIENVENLILVELREMRAEMTREFSAVRDEIGGVDAKADGRSLLLSVLAGHVPDSKRASNIWKT